MAGSFPSDELDMPGTAARLLGSWFGRDSAEFQQPVGLVKSVIDLFRSSDLLRDFLKRLGDRRTAPLENRLGIRPIVLRESEANQSAAVPRYGEDDVYGGGTSYGEPGRLAETRFPLTESFSRIGLLADRPNQQTVCWFPGLDFVLEQGRIRFRKNPFDDSRLSPATVWTDGEPADRELTLWALDARRDTLDLQNRYGFVLGLPYASTDAYRRLMNAVWDAWSFGASQDTMQRAVAAIADAPVAEVEETVLEIAEDDRSRLIITASRTYRASKQAQMLVAVGDMLKPGRPLTDAVVVTRVSGFSSVSGLAGLSLDSGWLIPGFLDAVSFDNRDVEVTTRVENDRLVVEFPLGGWPGDADLFWSSLHERGLAAGSTLAMLLDPRESPDGEPFAASMPTTINPLRFLADNVLRNRATVVRLRPAGFGPGALPPHFLQVVRAIAHPWHGVLVILELALTGDDITMNAPGDASRPGVEEGPLATYDLAVADDDLDVLLITESPRLRDLDGVCV